jgi:chromosome segregation ATPase
MTGKHEDGKDKKTAMCNHKSCEHGVFSGLFCVYCGYEEAKEQIADLERQLADMKRRHAMYYSADEKDLQEGIEERDWKIKEKDAEIKELRKDVRDTYRNGYHAALAAVTERVEKLDKEYTEIKGHGYGNVVFLNQVLAILRDVQEGKA